MRVLKTKTFARWTRKEGVADAALRAAVEEMRAGLVDANLGAGLVKKRIARPGRGKSGGGGRGVAANLGGRGGCTTWARSAARPCASSIRCAWRRRKFIRLTRSNGFD